MKRKFRIGVLCLIALLLLIPLLSQPVAAAPHYTYSTANTDNKPTGPTASVTVPGNTMALWDGSGTITFICTYTFKDTFPPPSGMGSEHKADLNVTRTSPTSATFSTTTGWIFISANGGTVNGQLTLMDTYSVSTGWSWTINVTCWCKDLKTGLTVTSGTSSYTWGI